jgi:tRNA(Ile)-lysidine synthetase-like protein
MAAARARCLVEAVLLEALRSRGLEQEAHIAVGYSGGPDSSALLAALCALGSHGTGNSDRPIAIYVDHGLRPRTELDAELDIVRGNCASLGARLVVARIRPGRIAKRARASGEGIEAEARRYRYRALRSVYERESIRAILLAHTLDDQLETILMRLVRGSGSGGIRGIPAVSGPFIRPFLGLEKADLLSYLGLRGLRFSTDSTNASTVYLRNRIRGELVPLLNSSFPGWRQGLARASAKAREDDDALSSLARSFYFSSPANLEGESSTPASPLLAAPEALAIRALVEAGGRITKNGRFSSSLAASALKALRGGEGAVYRGGGIEFSLRGGRIHLRRGLDFPRTGGYFVLIDHPRRIRVGKLEVRSVWRDSSRREGEGPGIRADAFRFPLVVRSRRPGDAIALAGGTKRLDELFSEWALPEDARGSVPILEDRDGIVAVLGAAFGGRDRYRVRPAGASSEGEGARRLEVMVKGA